MTFRRLLWRNLIYYWRGNLAVCLGVAVGTAVLVGALLVGDSLRGSLRDLTEKQLGWVDQALVVGRFFREELAGELMQDRAAEGVAPAILLQGTATVATAGHPQGRRAGRVTILGVDDRFWQGGDQGPADGFWQSSRAEVEINQTLADELVVKPGDTITLHLQKASAIPRETPFGRRDAGETLTQLQLQVRAVLPDASMGSRFSLYPSPTPPRNAFVPLRQLQGEAGQQGRCNALLVRGGRADLAVKLRQHWTLDDWGLILWDPESRTRSLFDKLDRNRDGELSRAEWRDRVAHTLAELADKDSGKIRRAAVQDYYKQRGYLSLESKQLLLESAVARAAVAAAKDARLQAAPTLVYLANTIAADGKQIPYSLIAAVDPALPAPLGPFLPRGVSELAHEEMVLVGWDQSPLPMKAGTTVSLTFFEPVEQGRLPERTVTFRLAGVLPLAGAADDADLTPEFPGITDKLTLQDWNPTFPYDGRRIQKRDEDFWNRYRTTPKAYIRLAKGQELWGTRFGQLTSIRLAPVDGSADLGHCAALFQKMLLERLDPEQGGFVFDHVRQHGLEASVGGTDFSGLFLGFSVFLIAAALLLVGLLFRLNLDRRAGDIGLLLALGHRHRKVRTLLLLEGAVVALGGGVLGCLGALAYAWVLLAYLNSQWPGELDRSFLTLHVTATSILLGYCSACSISLATIAWAVRILGKTPPTLLLRGQTTSIETEGLARRPRWAWGIAAGATGLGIGLLGLGGFLHDHMQQAGAFFGGGALLLTGGLAGVWIMLHRDGAAAGGRPEWPPRRRIVNLGMRNAGRHPVRSLLTAGLLAAAAFLIVAVESFRRQPGEDFLQENGGSGGFALLAEADLPIYQDLNAGAGRQEILDALDRHFRQQRPSEGPTADEMLKHVPAALAEVKIVPFRLKSGDDASCLNLYQPRRPRLLGAPKSLIERGGFHFQQTLAASEAEQHNPWLLLQRPRQAQDPIPVFAEENTVVWMLKSKLGGEVQVPNEQGEQVRLRIVGLLKDSIFQSELVMTENALLQLYPSQQGYNFFLIQTPPTKQTDVASLLETALASRGFDVTPSAKRLADYLAVENTYLSTFQALGGLGLLLGSLGLAVVLLRSVLERRGELALLRALGFRRQVLGELVLIENAFLLILGLLVGSGAALVSVVPHMVAGAGSVPWLRLLGLLALVLVVGLAAGGAALRATLRAPLLPALRRE